MQSGGRSERASRALLITGATGFLGSNFLLSVLGRFSKVFAVVRGDDAVSARARLLEKLAHAARHRQMPFFPESVGDRLEVIAGDVADPDLGVDASSIRAAIGDSPIDFWHFAATLEYEGRHRKRIEATNVGGTRYALALHEKLGGARFVYISTAYVAGTRTGAIPEQLLPEEGPFNNAYEESKCRAEWEVFRFCASRAIDYRILRPAIVVGPLRTHRTGGSDSGLYGFVRLMHRMADVLRAVPDGAIVLGEPETKVHLTPVDGFCVDAERLLDPALGEQRVFHAVAPGSVTGGDLQAILTDVLGLPSFHLRAERSRSPAPVERVLDRVMALYGVAVRHPKTFERAIPSEEFITPADTRAYVRESLLELEGESIDRLFETHAIASYDGTPLVTHAVGDRSKRCVVLVNAFGMTVEFWRTIAADLANDRFVLTWDSRGIPSFSETFPDDACDVTAHAYDLEAVLRAHGVDGPVDLVGWCTGAQVALRFRALRPERVRSIALLNGAFSFPESVGVTDFKRNIMYLMPRVAESRAHAVAYHRMLFGKGVGERSREERAAAGDRATVETALLASDQLVSNLTSAPFKDAESLYRYAKLVMHLVREPEHVWAEGIREPVLVLSGDHDTVAHPAESREIARRIPHAELVVGEEWDHFSLLHDRAVAATLRRFLERATPDPLPVNAERNDVLTAQAS